MKRDIWGDEGNGKLRQGVEKGDKRDEPCKGVGEEGQVDRKVGKGDTEYGKGDTEYGKEDTEYGKGDTEYGKGDVQSKETGRSLSFFE